jgi:tetratricopeptide (TPR) repeat protein
MGLGDPARDRSASALALARQIGTPEVLFQAGRIVTGPAAPLGWPEAYRVAKELIEAGRNGVDLFNLARTLYGAGSVLFSQGDRDATEVVWRELEELGTRTRDTYVLLRGPFVAAVRAMVDGRSQEAIEQAERLGHMANELGSADFGQRWRGLLALRPRLHLGRAEEALSGAPNPEWRTLCSAHLGRESDVRTHIEGSARSSSLNVMAIRLEAACLIGDREMAASLAMDLSKEMPAHLLSTPENAGTSFGRLLSMAAVLNDQLDAAEDYCRQALATCERARFRPELALCHLQLAEVLLKQAQGHATAAPRAEEPRQEALGHLDFATKEFEAMKMRPSLEKAVALNASITT